jgi:protocatechuate 3,4-dioxygenase beta subunit
MIKKINLIIFLLLSLVISKAWAFTIDVNQSDAQHFKTCMPTKSLGVKNDPIEIISNNNLTQKVGAFTDKLTPKIIIFGRVRDKNCIAIPNAAISVWQTDEYGVYRYIRVVDTGRSIYDMDDQIYSNFQGVGSVTSTNTGEFAFITVHPSKGNRGNIGGVIDIVITHDNFPDIKTKILLVEKNQTVPKTNYVLANNIRMLGNGVKVYYFDIVLDGTHQYLNY